MEEEIKDKNENINANELNSDRVEEFDKNIYKESKLAGMQDLDDVQYWMK